MIESCSPERFHLIPTARDGPQPGRAVAQTYLQKPFARMIQVPLVLFRHDFHTGGVALGFSEAGRWNSFVLMVRENYSLPGQPLQGLRKSFIANTEREYLRRNARLRKHSGLALQYQAAPLIVWCTARTAMAPTTANSRL
jgi:hypothetical protein